VSFPVLCCVCVCVCVDLCTFLYPSYHFNSSPFLHAPPRLPKNFTLSPTHRCPKITTTTTTTIATTHLRPPPSRISTLPTRSRFLTGASPILLLTERFYYYNRIPRIRGARSVLFYGPPTASHFYSEVCNAVASYAATPTASASFSSSSPASVSTLFTRWDALALERVVGTERVGKMCDESNARTTFSFL